MLLSHAVPSTAAVLRLGSARQRTDLGGAGAPGCFLLASDDTVLPAVADLLGNATVPVSFPNTAALVATRFYAQFVCPDAAANALGTTTSQGAEGRIGRQ